MSNERPHHPFSPSTLQLRELCPKYSSRGGTSEAAERGTAQHNAVELEEDSEDLQDHEALAVQSCIEFVDNLKATKYADNLGHVLKEEYLPVDGKKIRIGEEVHEGTTAGYADVILVSKDQKFADVVDWKFGMFQVTDAKDNLQGIAYLLGAVRKFPKVREVTVNFIAPHRDEWTFHTFTRDEFQELYVRVTSTVRRSIRACNTGWDMATPSASPCSFCAFADGRCPKLNAFMLTIGRKVEPLEIPETLTPELVSDPKDAGVGLKLSGVTKAWAERYRAFLSSKAVDELDFVPEGYILQKASRRIVKSVNKVRAIAETFGVKPEEFDGASEVALGKLEKIISATAPRGSKGLRVDEFSAALLEGGAVEKGVPYAFLKMKKGVKE